MAPNKNSAQSVNRIADRIAKSWTQDPGSIPEVINPRRNFMPKSRFMSMAKQRKAMYGASGFLVPFDSILNHKGIRIETNSITQKKTISLFRKNTKIFVNGFIFEVGDIKLPILENGAFYCCEIFLNPITLTKFIFADNLTQGTGKQCHKYEMGVGSYTGPAKINFCGFKTNDTYEELSKNGIGWNTSSLSDNAWQFFTNSEYYNIFKLANQQLFQVVMRFRVVETSYTFDFTGNKIPVSPWGPYTPNPNEDYYKKNGVMNTYASIDNPTISMMPMYYYNPTTKEKADYRISLNTENSKQVMHEVERRLTFDWHFDSQLVESAPKEMINIPRECHLMFLSTPGYGGPLFKVLKGIASAQLKKIYSRTITDIDYKHVPNVGYVKKLSNDLIKFNEIPCKRAGILYMTYTTNDDGYLAVGLLINRTSGAVSSFKPSDKARDGIFEHYLIRTNILCK